MVSLLVSNMRWYRSPYTLKYTYGVWPPKLKSQNPHTRARANAAPFPLMSLAPELHLIVAENLDPFDRLSLTLTNRHFFHLIPFVQLSLKDLSLAQAWLYKRRGPDSQAVPGTNIKNDKFPYLACMSCLRLRLSTKFADDQTRWSPVLKVPRRLIKTIVVKGYSLQQRFCINCGIHEKRNGFQPGQIVKVNDEEFLICNFCSHLGRNVEKGSRRCAAALSEECWSMLEIAWGDGEDGEDGEDGKVE